MLAQRPRRWANIKQTLVQRVVSAEMALTEVSLRPPAAG